jgi:pimeloyl-ACP methyl ester carboxylesterase
MIMSASDIALNTPNQSVAAANGVTYAYRRFGAGSPDVLPLVMLQHFRGNLDDWDPLLLGALASGRVMAQHLPDARVRIYPDSGHGFLVQWPEQFAELVHRFLGGPGEDWAA